MKNHTKILLIEANGDDLIHCKQLLSFIGVEVVRYQELSSKQDFTEFQAIFLGEPFCEGHLSLDKESDALLKRLSSSAQKTPLVMINKSGKTSPKIYQFSVDWPFKYQQIITVLNQCMQIAHVNDYEKAYFAKAKNQLLLGNSKSIQETRRLIMQVAKTDATVLITGESGTGKEVVAQQIHDFSDKQGEFVAVNCGAIPSELLESELFGHEKGAFTGAVSSRQGRFELAKGGTLFLDEIGDMPHAMQVKLLRVLQERKFERVGSNKSIMTDVRVIAATHQNLLSAMKSGDFREDLYYRINVFPIEIAPLRNRSEDIAVLADEFIAKHTTSDVGPIKLLADALIKMSQYHWPGNIRELTNVIERMMILYPSGVISEKELPNAITQKSSTVAHEVPDLNDQEQINLKERVHQIEMFYIKQALDKNNWVVAHAADMLDIRRTTLVEKMKKYGLNKPSSLSESADN